MSVWDDLAATKGYHLYAPGKEEATDYAFVDLGKGFLTDFFGPKSDYVLEVWSASGDSDVATLERSIILPIHPEAIEIVRPTHTRTTYTLGVQPNREHSTHRNLSIKLRGVSGLARRNAHNRKGSSVFRPGPELLRELDAFLNFFQSRAVKRSDYFTNPLNYRNRGESAYLVLRSFSEHLHVRVEVTNWRMGRDAKTNRFSYNWELDLQAYAPATPTKAPSMLDAFGDVSAISDKVSELINSVNDAGGMVTNATESIYGVLNSIRGPVQAMQGMAEQFRGVVEGLSSIANIPRLFLTDAANVFATGRNAIAKLSSDFGSSNYDLSGIFETFISDQELNAVTDMVSEAEVLATTAVGTIGAVGCGVEYGPPLANTGEDPTLASKNSGEDPGKSVANQYAMPGPSPRFPTADLDREARSVVVSEGQTVRELARIWMGDSRYWIAICELNKMPSPYQKRDGTPLTTGDVLRIPVRSVFLQQALLSPTQNMERDRFGKDLYVDPKTGDLAIVGGDEGDVRTIRDKENLEQAIRHRLLTKQGECSFWQSYGLPPFIGQKMTAESLGYLASHLHSQLMRDPRVVELDTMRLTDEGDELTAFLEVVPLIGPSISVISAL